MLLSIEPESDIPLYLQLRNQIVDARVRGELQEGDSLPSVRQLARDLGINLHTVNKAYQVLEEEGYLKIFGRRGAKISALPHFDEQYLEQLETTLSHLFIEARSRGVDTSLLQQSITQALNASDASSKKGA